MTQKRSVFIVGGSYSIALMFQKHGWGESETIKSADLVQFTGGADVTPSLYGQGRHKETYSQPERDRYEGIIFHTARKLEKPMAGICRGGQFLNVMCGGSMWQHSDKHRIAGTHQVIDEVTGEVFQATSTHHQIMVPGKNAFVVANAQETSFKERCDLAGKTYTVNTKGKDDAEIIFYEKERCFCFQPHPEGINDKVLSGIYFDYLETYLFNN